MHCFFFLHFPPLTSAVLRLILMTFYQDSAKLRRKWQKSTQKSIEIRTQIYRNSRKLQQNFFRYRNLFNLSVSLSSGHSIRGMFLRREDETIPRKNRKYKYSLDEVVELTQTIFHPQKVSSPWTSLPPSRGGSWTAPTTTRRTAPRAGGPSATANRSHIWSPYVYISINDRIYILDWRLHFHYRSYIYFSLTFTFPWSIVYIA